MYICAPHMPQRRVLDPLELVLQKVVWHHVGAKNQTQVLYKHSKCSNY